MIKADMHVHTYYSDGMMSPEQVVEKASENGVALLAVTDHDNMNGCAQVEESCKQKGILYVPGLEISAYDGVKVHVLGYHLDDQCQAYQTFYKKIYDGSQERCEEILRKLRRVGIRLTLDDVNEQRFTDKSPIHTMHIARAAVKKGYGSKPGAFYMSNLSCGKCAYSDVGRISSKEAVRVINECHGVASLAHPGRIEMDKFPKEKLLKSLVAEGLSCMEVYYSSHTEKETAYYKELAGKYGLVCTGGSDTHYEGGSREIGQPNFYPSEELLALLKIC